MNINNSKLAPDTGKTNNDSNDVFGMDLYYNTSDGHLTSQVYYDGKMASAKWTATNASGTKGNERAFVYGYDGVNRYTGETYSERATSGSSSFTITHGWDENSIKYDASGNVQALRRDSSVQGTLTANSGILIDQLKYTYSSSIPDQLYTVYDSSGSAKGFIGGGSGSHYSYDANGNLTNEPYQGITGITYNVLNRTDSTKLSGTTYITYTYNAAGILLRKKAYNSGTLTQTDYIGGFVYTGNGTTQTLAYAPMPEGRLLGAALTQEYVITDPQGNARVAFQNVSGVAKVTQENSYYGYGLLMPGSLVGWSAPPNKNLYNGGSEWQNDTKAVNAGVPDYYQTYYRNYDPALARWVGVDPMAEGSASMSVYHYSGDNPVMMNDPDGDKSAAPGSQQYVDQDNALQGAFQNMYQGSIGGGGGGGGGGDGGDGKFAEYWNTVINAAESLIAGMNAPNSTISSINFQNPYALAIIAFQDPGDYMVSFANGMATLSPVGDESNSTVSTTTPMLKVNDIPSDITDPGNGSDTENDASQGGYEVGFKQFASLIIGESSADHPNTGESAGIGSSIINRINAVGTSLNDPKWINKVGTASAYNGVETARYKISMKLSIDQIAAKYPTQFAGILQAYNNWGTDYGGNANPSYYWTAVGLTSGYAYDQYQLGNMIRNTIGNTTFYAFKVGTWQWTP